MLSKKDHELVARTLKEVSSNRAGLTDWENSLNHQTVALVARTLADEFKAQNPRFRYDHFFELAGLDEFGYRKCH